MRYYLLLTAGNGWSISPDFVGAVTVGCKYLWTLVGLPDKRFENNFVFYFPTTIMAGALAQGGGRNNQCDLVITEDEVP